MDKFYDMSRRAKKWALFATILYFCLAALMIVSFEKPSEILSIVMYFAFAVLMLLYYLSLNKAIKEDDIEHFEQACENQGRFIKVSGIIAMITFVFTIIGVIVVFFAIMISSLT